MPTSPSTASRSPAFRRHDLGAPISTTASSSPRTMPSSRTRSSMARRRWTGVRSAPSAGTHRPRFQQQLHPRLGRGCLHRQRHRGSIDSNRFEDNGNQILTESTQTIISNNQFVDSLGSQVGALPFVPTVESSSYILGNNTFEGGPREVVIYPVTWRRTERHRHRVRATRSVPATTAATTASVRVRSR